ncbi:MAG: LPS assembly protein LptD [Deltaproteobacteria bacterium]|nr:LPS assembly protein LptD [Deltaproteobacteria bacterium]MDA8308687.1 LPS assembly protein LptD [Deltaproteobacteria bacterium]
MRKVFGKRIFLRSSVFFCALALGTAICGNACATQPTSPLSAATAVVQTKVPWTIHADKLVYDAAKHTYEAKGHVKISAPGRLIEADYASIDNKTRQADLHGNVTVEYGRNWLKGDDIVWNLDTETGTISSGVMYFAKNNFFVQGSSISKTGPTQFEVGPGFITSCNPAAPSWKVQFKKLQINVGGAGWITDSSFWANKYQLAYWPLMELPLETQRQSGFLMPYMGASTLNGFHFEVPYYWAIRQDMDATFFGQYLQNRGFMGGLQYRINNTKFGEGIWMFNYLQDQASKSFLASEGYPFQTRDRYWLRGYQQVQLPDNISAKILLDYVSDRNFLQEFASGSSSYFMSDQQFLSYFNQGILYDPNSLVRESTIYLEKRGESDLFSLDFRYWENLQTVMNDTTTQQLPAFYYSVLPSSINGTPFYYSLNSSAVNYWSPKGTDEQRVDVFPQLFDPMQWGNYINIEPSVGLRNDAYSIQWAQPNSGNNYAGREVPDVNVVMSSRLNKVYPVNFLGYTAIQHSIEPEISYEYATQTTSSVLPQLDRLDLYQGRNGIRYGFTTFLTGKQITLNDSGTPTVTYREIARLRVFQFFNIQAPSIPSPLFDSTALMPNGFSPLGVRLDLMPVQSWNFSYDLDWDFGSSQKVQAQSLVGTYTGGRGNFLMVDYEQIPTLDVNEISLTTYFHLYGNFYLSTYHNYSFLGGLFFTQGYGIRYVMGCWGLGAGIEQTGPNTSFLFTVDLMGIGSVGNQATFFGLPQFGEAFPGYQHPETWILNR